MWSLFIWKRLHKIVKLPSLGSGGSWTAGCLVYSISTVGSRLWSRCGHSRGRPGWWWWWWWMWGDSSESTSISPHHLSPWLAESSHHLWRALAETRAWYGNHMHMYSRVCRLRVLGPNQSTAFFFLLFASVKANYISALLVQSYSQDWFAFHISFPPFNVTPVIGSLVWFERLCIPSEIQPKKMKCYYP